MLFVARRSRGRSHVENQTDALLDKHSSLPSGQEPSTRVEGVEDQLLDLSRRATIVLVWTLLLSLLLCHHLSSTRHLLKICCHFGISRALLKRGPSERDAVQASDPTYW